MALLIGIDLGTTGCKAVVYDERGIALGESYLEYGLITLSATMVEQDPHAWWDLTLQAVNAALDAAAADRSAVVWHRGELTGHLLCAPGRGRPAAGQRHQLAGRPRNG